MDVKYFTLIILAQFLTACATTKDARALLADEFEIQSEVYEIDTPTWRIPDSVYNKKIGNYSIIDADTSSRSLKDRFISSHVQENIINFFVFGDKTLYNKIKEFEVISTRNYSFAIKNSKLGLSKSECVITSISIDERREALVTNGSKDKSNFPDFSSHDSATNRYSRGSTALSCEINQDDEVYHLNLFSNENRKTDVAISSDTEEIIIENIDHYIILEMNTDYNDKNTGTDEIYYPRRYAINSGLELYMNAEQVSALSFVGKPRIWLKGNLKDEKKQLFLTVNYSLLMFNWLDSAWR